jgi:PKD repeat protein
MVCMPFILYSQHEGDQWVIGYNSGGSPDYSIMHIDFSQDNPTIEYHFEEVLHISETASNICDSQGEAILWTNGMQIFGKNGIMVEDTIAFDNEPNSYWKFYDVDIYGPSGFLQVDGAIILPYPDHENEFEVLYHTADPKPNGYFAVNQFLEARIKMNPDTSYSVLYKDHKILPNHEWYTSRIIASRHGNGRDWWIITFEADSPYYYSYVLDPEGLHLDHKGEFPRSIYDGPGMTTFSNFGNYIARTDGDFFEDLQTITLFSFNRCTGVLKYKEKFSINAGGVCGVAFSPDEHFLYGNNYTEMWQWDLLTKDIAVSKTLVDFYNGFIEPGWQETKFGPMQLAADGRIYGTLAFPSSKRFHVIDRPNLFSPFCNFFQNHINLGNWNGRSSPNIPNYRLGPSDGSPCDTLGLNNYPVSKWRFEANQKDNPFRILFTNLSYYDPHKWHWDFDDGKTSEFPGPLHTFESGLYHVCLTVSNENGSDSTCRWVEILPTSIQEELSQNIADVTIMPNPFINQLQIQTKANEFHDVQIQIFNMHGHIMFYQSSVFIPSKLFVPEFPPGLYLCNILEDGKLLTSVKLMKIE